MSSIISSLQHKLKKPTSFFGIRLWVMIVVCVVLISVAILIILCLIYYHRRRPKKYHFSQMRPVLFKDFRSIFSASSLDRRLLARNTSGIEMNIARRPEHHGVISDQRSSHASGTAHTSDVDLESVNKSPVGSGFSLREIEVATNEFDDENLIGNGDYGVVYRGISLDNRRVAVKKLCNNSCQAENFKVEVEAIEQVTHKNLVKLLGYCMEGAYRMLVCEYVDNGNLYQWLHGCVSQVSPLTWEIRMKIIVGTAKGLAYLHEDVEPRILHHNIKSSNILLDRQWNPKISDFGLPRLFEESNLTTRAMRTYGYLGPRYACTGILTEKSDVYSLGILIMEIISARTPIDYRRPQEEVYLIDWLKSMVANQKLNLVVDPKLPELPSSKELKRILLISLRCVDPDIENRPQMGDVIHMLEPRDLLLCDEQQIRREASLHNQP